jgi:hypothetical protein
VICAYLRMPYTPPDDQPPAEDATAEAHSRYEQRRQELQVRMTAQRILAGHLRRDAADAFWTGIDLNLTEAHLHELRLGDCHVKSAQFGGAQFSGPARFDGAQFGGPAAFPGAQFSGPARFDGTQFGGPAGFSGAQFGSFAGFPRAQFGGFAGFDGTQFGEFVGFDGTQFGGPAWFEQAHFSGGVRFDGARVRPGHIHSWPAGWTGRDARAADGEENGWMYLVRIEDWTE